MPIDEILVPGDRRLDTINMVAERLGFQYELLAPNGLTQSQISMVKRPNTRATDSEIEAEIDTFWERNAPPNAFRGARARYEGVHRAGDGVIIAYSDEGYGEHFFLRTTQLAKPYQALLFSINGIVLTQDNKLFYGLRDPKTTDQGETWHIIPAGFTDVAKIPELGEEVAAEHPMLTTARKYFTELSAQTGNYSEHPVNSAARELTEELSADHVPTTEAMKGIAIIYNSRSNFDMTMAVAISAAGKADDFTIISEHLRLDALGTDYDSLREALYNFSFTPDSNSGHFRGDIGATIAYLHGADALEDALHETSKRLNIRSASE